VRPRPLLIGGRKSKVPQFPFLLPGAPVGETGGLRP
jgi:hypothetical protein